MVNTHACGHHRGFFTSGIRIAAVKAAVMIRVSTMMMVQFTVGSCFDDDSRRLRIHFCKSAKITERKMHYFLNIRNKDRVMVNKLEDGKPFLFVFHIENIFKWQKYTKSSLVVP
jgi:hypothetical protein